MKVAGANHEDGAVVTRKFGPKVRPPSRERAAYTSTVCMPAQLRWSYQKASTARAELTETHGITWSFPGRSSFTRTGADQVTPRSVERDRKTSRAGTDGDSRSTQMT